MKLRSPTKCAVVEEEDQRPATPQHCEGGEMRKNSKKDLKKKKIITRKLGGKLGKCGVLEDKYFSEKIIQVCQMLLTGQVSKGII